ncbi:MAG TPA: serine hydrolase domain-containing protein [Terriglobales bacterium]|nr:serine hydrolase domain-containing protein [Terriglobales bacterium]
MNTPLDTDATTRTRVPQPQYENQERTFARAFDLLKDALERRVFPGASVAVTHSGNMVALNAVGQFTYEQVSPKVSTDTAFDVASLTKVIATTSMAMILYERGLLDLEMPIAQALPEFRGADEQREAVTFRQLLAHSSGLPAYEKLFLRARDKEELLRGAFSVPLKYSPGTHAEYSDIGFILLGVALERIANQALDSFCQKEVFGPLGMCHTTYNPPASWKSRVPPTANDETFRKRIIQGEVNDENASVMGGVAPHAGLFSTASDMAFFAHAILSGGAPILRPETVRIFTQRQAFPTGTSRTLGWDTPSGDSQSGRYFSRSSFGHLGYTGTSLWIDPERRISVTLLTNRTWPDCSNKAITEVRPKFHDAVMECLGVGG